MLCGHSVHSNQINLLVNPYVLNNHLHDCLNNMSIQVCAVKNTTIQFTLTYLKNVWRMPQKHQKSYQCNSSTLNTIIRLKLCTTLVGRCKQSSYHFGGLFPDNGEVKEKVSIPIVLRFPLSVFKTREIAENVLLGLRTRI